MTELTNRYANLVDAVQAARKAAPLTESNRVHDTGKIDETAVAFNIFTKLLTSHGLRDALYSLLRRTDYRFISIFRFRDGKATSVVHVDRQNLSSLQADEVPDTATYCCYVRDDKGSFVTMDALHDARTMNHVAKETIRSYCGIPIFDATGELMGTLCHYDVEPRDPDQLDLELLIQASNTIARSGTVPPYLSK